jgi:hypothetical protein
MLTSCVCVGGGDMYKLRLLVEKSCLLYSKSSFKILLHCFRHTKVCISKTREHHFIPMQQADRIQQRVCEQGSLCRPQIMHCHSWPPGYSPLSQAHNHVPVAQGERQDSVTIVVVVDNQLSSPEYTGQDHNRHCGNGRWGLHRSQNIIISTKLTCTCTPN